MMLKNHSSSIQMLNPHNNNTSITPTFLACLTGFVVALAVAACITFALAQLRSLWAPQAFVQSKLYRAFSEDIASPGFGLGPMELLSTVLPRNLPLIDAIPRQFTRVDATRAPQIQSTPIAPPGVAAPLMLSVLAPEPLDRATARWVPPNKSIFDRRIRRAQLTSGVDGYEPIDNLGFEVRLNPGRVRRVFWFNQGIDMKGMTVFQSWYYNDTLMSRLAIDIGGNQWRFSTYKTILPHQQGQWRVVTESEEMQPLAELRFQVTY